jgi:hypothetical protein
VENATHYFDVNCGHLVFRAVDHISKGSEVSTCYLGDVYQPMSERQAHLLKTKYFACRCRWCQNPTKPDVGENPSLEISNLNSLVDTAIREFQEIVTNVHGSERLASLRKMACLFEDYALSPHLPDLHFVKFSAIVNQVTCLLYLLASANEKQSEISQQQRKEWLKKAEEAIETVDAWAEQVFPCRSMVVGSLLGDFLEVLQLKYACFGEKYILEKGHSILEKSLCHFEACRGENSEAVRNVLNNAAWKIFKCPYPANARTRSGMVTIEKTDIFSVWNATRA